MRQIVVLSILFPACCNLAAPALGQDGIPPAQETTLTREFIELNGNIKVLTELMKTFLERKEEELNLQEKAILLRRLDVSIRKMAPLEEVLRQAKERRSGQERALAAMNEELQELDDAIKDNVMLRGASTIDEMQAMRRQYERYRKMNEEEISRLTLKEMNLEGDLVSLRDSIETMEKTIDQQLGLR